MLAGRISIFFFEEKENPKIYDNPKGWLNNMQPIFLQ